MTWTKVAENTFAFADGAGGGHSCNLGSAPNVGEIDVFFVNSDATVSTPSGFTLPTNGSRVNEQGAYGFYRIAAGGEGSTVTVVTGSNANTFVNWERWSGGASFDVAKVAGIDLTAGNTTPALNTGTLSSANELVIACALLHAFTNVPASPSYSSGYTAGLSGNQGTGAGGVAQFIMYRTDAGTAAENPNISWSALTNANDRYIIVLAFVKGADTVTGAVSATVTASATVTGANAAAGAASQTATAAATVTGANAAAGAASQTVTAATTATGAVAAPGDVTATATAGTTATAVISTTGAVTSTATAGATSTGAVTAVGAATSTATSSVTATAVVGSAAEHTTTADAVVEATVTGAARGSWYQLLDIVREARDLARQDRQARPVACPNDGEPLKTGPRGELYCPWDGWREGR